MIPDNIQLFQMDPLRDLTQLIAEARSRGASRLLILAGKPVVCRVEGKLSAPLHPDRVHFRQTQALAEALLSEDQAQVLDKSGAVEVDFKPDDEGPRSGDPVPINVFFGDGAHNVVVFLTKHR